MIIRPPKSRRDPVTPALLVDEGRARDLATGRVHDLARLPKGLRAYVSWEDADEYARSGRGELVAWGDEPIRYRSVRHGDSHLRRSDVVIVKVPADTRKELEHGLSQWVEWLARWDTNPGWSLGGTSMSLLRRTLANPLVTTLGQLPAARWTLGGRQQCFVEPGTVVRGAVQLDLPAAYTHVVGGLRYGGAWRRVDTVGVAAAWHSHGFPVLVRADVRLPADLNVGPLHRRPARRPDTRVEEIAPTVPYPTSGRMTGLWTYAELEQADADGASIRVLEGYVHAGADTVFADWHDAIMDGRAMPGYAGQLAKATGNALWGQFVIDDRKRLQVQRWNGGYTARPVQGSRGHQVRAWDVGEIVCGTVRAKLYEMLRIYSDRLVACHTDGLWIRDVGPLDRIAFGSQLPEDAPWRLKTDAAELHVLDQQKYRYRLRRGRTWNVVFSGVPATRAEDTFQRLWKEHA